MVLVGESVVYATDREYLVSRPLGDLAAPTPHAFRDDLAGLTVMPDVFDNAGHLRVTRFDPRGAQFGLEITNPELLTFSETDDAFDLETDNRALTAVGFVAGPVPGFPAKVMFTANWHLGCIEGRSVNARGLPDGSVADTILSGLERPRGLTVDPHSNALLVGDETERLVVVSWP